VISFFFASSVLPSHRPEASSKRTPSGTEEILEHAFHVALHARDFRNWLPRRHGFLFDFLCFGHSISPFLQEFLGFGVKREEELLLKNATCMPAKIDQTVAAIIRISASALAYTLAFFFWKSSN
jgi:hypothetical protein